MSVSFSDIGGAFVITDSVLGITYSGNNPMRFNKINSNTVEIVVANLGGSGNPSVIGNYSLSDITTIGGVPVSGTIDGAIAQLNDLLVVMPLLPEGAATSAKQDTGNTSLSSIDSKTPALSGGKVPVTDPTSLPLPTGASTSAKQDTGNTSLSSIDTKLPSKIALNGVASISADSFLVREYDFPLSVAQGLVSGCSWVPKSGKNPDVDTASVPEDVWGGSSVYTGFPTGAAEVIQAVSDSASDTGTLTIVYLASNTSTAYQNATVTLNGTTPVDFSVSGIRVHSAFYSDGTATGFNVGNITIRHKVTTANVFLYMLPATNQTYCSGYTIPYNCTGYLYDMFAQIQDGATGTIEACLWTRLNGASPRLRRNFVAAQGADYSNYMGGTLVFPALTDIIVRVTSCSANNTIVLAGYDLLLVSS